MPHFYSDTGNDVSLEMFPCSMAKTLQHCVSIKQKHATFICFE